LLEGVFRFDAPGVYPIRAWHKVDFRADAASLQTLASQEVTTEFELGFIEGSEEELASAYAPILRDVKIADPIRSSLARSAVVQNPPQLLEDVILAMADDPHTVDAAISGLQRLATRRAKAKLAELSGAGKPEAVRQMAITALGGLGDPTYCSLMRDIAQESREYSRFIALRAAGYLCGERALPLVTSQLASADQSPRYEAAYALGNSHSRKAVPLLIPLLLDPDSDVRRAARESLAALTHRRSKNDGRPAQEIYRDWTNWWASHRASAPIYGIDECKEPEPLP
jgi:HEAT repeat protein